MRLNLCWRRFLRSDLSASGQVKRRGPRALALGLVLVLIGCSRQAPQCPYVDSRERAPSAGCFTQRDGQLLLVQGLSGTVSLPGGLARAGESARCTAFRESWEETGLLLVPREVLRVFSTGFYLSRCEHGEGLVTPSPATRFEVRQALYLSADRFGDFTWRYPAQERLLGRLLTEQAHETSD